jgi:hypothetical protein
MESNGGASRETAVAAMNALTAALDCGFAFGYARWRQAGLEPGDAVEGALDELLPADDARLASRLLCGEFDPVLSLTDHPICGVDQLGFMVEAGDRLWQTAKESQAFLEFVPDIS